MGEIVITHNKAIKGILPGETRAQLSATVASGGKRLWPVLLLLCRCEAAPTQRRIRLQQGTRQRKTAPKLTHSADVRTVTLQNNEEKSISFSVTVVSPLCWFGRKLKRKQTSGQREAHSSTQMSCRHQLKLQDNKKGMRSPCGSTLPSSGRQGTLQSLGAEGTKEGEEQWRAEWRQSGGRAAVLLKIFMEGDSNVCVDV